MVTYSRSKIYRLLLTLCVGLVPMLTFGQTNLVKGPRWYDEGKLSRRIKITDLVEGKKMPLFEQCVDGQFHVAVQLKYDIEGRKPFINWFYGLNVELIEMQSNDQGFIKENGQELEHALFIGTTGASEEGIVELKVSNNEEQTFVSSALYGKDNKYISCNKVDNNTGNKLSYFVRVTGLPTNLDELPNEDIYLEFRLYEKPRYWSGDYKDTPQANSYLQNKNGIPISFDVKEVKPDELIRASWEYAEGAWGYELEWVFLSEEECNVLSETGVPSAHESEDIFNNEWKAPVRIETNLQHYELTATYPKGDLFFRVRAVGRHSTDHPNQVTQGDWVYMSGAGIKTDGFSRKVTHGGNELAIDLTWQAVTTFAEEGKSKKVVTYYDNSLRPRQVTTDLSTDKHTLVAETYYDHEGRGTINVLPVPDPTNSLKFRPLVNKFNLEGQWASGNPKAYYDNLEEASITLSDQHGAGKYYSSNNDVGGIHRDYIPDAAGYAYTQVVYENDGTGRVKAQSGIGAQFHLKDLEGKFNKTVTRFFYSTPEQKELIRLFGQIEGEEISRAGDANFFQKQLAVDPNGQISVSYSDQEGRVRATGLFGSEPSNLDAVPTRDRDGGGISVDLVNRNQTIKNVNKVTKDIMNGDGKNLYTFTYDIGDVVSTAITNKQIVGESIPDYAKEEETEFNVSVKYRVLIEILDPTGKRVPLQAGTHNNPEEFPDESNSIKTIDGLYGYEEILSEADLDPNEEDEVIFTVLFDQLGTYTVTKYLQLIEESEEELTAKINRGEVEEVSGYNDLKAHLKTEFTEEVFGDGTDCDLTGIVEEGPEEEDVVELTKLSEALSECEVLLFQIEAEVGNEGDVTTHDAYCFYQACVANAASKVFDSELRFGVKAWTEAKNYQPIAAQLDGQVAVSYDLTNLSELLQADYYFSNEFNEDRLNKLEVLAGMSEEEHQSYDPTLPLEGAGQQGTMSSRLNNMSMTIDDGEASFEIVGTLLEIVDPNTPIEALQTPSGTGNILYGNMNAEEIDQQRWTYFISIYQMEKMRLETEMRANGGCQTEPYPAIVFDPRPYLETSMLEIQNNLDEDEDGEIDPADLVEPDYATQAEVALLNYLNRLGQGCYELIVAPEPVTGGRNADYLQLHQDLFNYFSSFPDGDRYNLFGSIYDEDVSLANGPPLSATGLGQPVPAYYLQEFTQHLNAICSEVVTVDYDAMAYAKLQEILNVIPYNCRESLENPESDYLSTLETSLKAYYLLQGDQNPSGSILDEDVNSLTAYLATPEGETPEPLTDGALHLKDVYDLINGQCPSDPVSFKWAMVRALDPMACAEMGYEEALLGFVALPAYTFKNDDKATISLPNNDRILQDHTFIEVDINVNFADYPEGDNQLKVFPIISTPFSEVANIEHFEFGIRKHSNGIVDLYFRMTVPDNENTHWTTWHSLNYDSGEALNGCYTVALQFLKEHSRLYVKYFAKKKGETEYLTVPLSSIQHFEHQYLYTPIGHNELMLHQQHWPMGDVVMDGFIQDVRIYRSDRLEPLGWIDYEFEGTAYQVSRDLSNEVEVDELVGQWLLADETNTEMTLDVNNEGGWNSGESSCLVDFSYGQQEVCIAYNGTQPGGSFTGGGQNFELTPEVIEGLKEDCENRKGELVTTLLEGDMTSELQRILATVRNEHRKNALENITESFSYSYAPKDYHFTLYYYDQAGSLIQTVPPEGVRILSQDDLDNGERIPKHQMKTRYAYNSLGEIIWQRTPDGGTSKIWYDKLGRARLSQNAQQQLDGKYAYTKFDEQGRVKEVGQLERALNNSGLMVTQGDERFDELDFPSSRNFVLDERTITHYDNLDEMPHFPNKEHPDFKQENLRGRVAWTEVINTKHALRVNPDDRYSDYVVNAVMYDYDIHGNVRKMLQASVANRITEYDFDLISGNVKHVDFHDEDFNDRFIHRYRYDADNRITSVETSTDGYIWYEDAHYYYYAHGPLARVELGEYKVQGLDYFYTLQGWIKGVNAAGQGAHADLGRDGYNHEARNRYVSRDAFAYGLGYYEGDYSPIGNRVNPDATTNWQPFAAEEDLSKGGVRKHTGVDKYGLFNGNIALMATDLRYFGDEGLQMMAYQYDQLNRIRKANAYEQKNDSWNKPYQKFGTSYQYDANGNIMELKRHNGVGMLMDNLTYHYGKRKLTDSKGNVLKDGSGNDLEERINRLRHVYDWGVVADAPPNYDYVNAIYNAFNEDTDGPEVGSGNLNDKDFISQGADNYEYDAIGNLIRDKSEGILKIEWTISGKVKRVLKEDGSQVIYQYDATGNRLLKRVQWIGKDEEKLTLYYRDASGNTMQTYKKHYDEKDKKEYVEKEYSIYGSSRVGMYRTKDVIGGEKLKGVAEGQLTLGSRSYELSNHLHNVLTVITDNKQMATDEDGNLLIGEDEKVAYFETRIVSANDYYPFGLGMEERRFEDEEYRYGFNGKENDKDFGNKQVIQDYGFRVYNPSIGKFLSVDPLTPDYPWFTPYQFAGNTPIRAIDLDGLEPYIEDGILIGFNVLPGMGPTQIAEYLNNPWNWGDPAEGENSFILLRKVDWREIVEANRDVFLTKDEGGTITDLDDKFDEGYKKMKNLWNGRFLSLDFIAKEMKAVSGLNKLINSIEDKIGQLDKGIEESNKVIKRKEHFLRGTEHLVKQGPTSPDTTFDRKGEEFFKLGISIMRIRAGNRINEEKRKITKAEDDIIILKKQIETWKSLKKDRIAKSSYKGNQSGTYPESTVITVD